MEKHMASSANTSVTITNNEELSECSEDYTDTVTISTLVGFLQEAMPGPIKSFQSCSYTCRWNEVTFRRSRWITPAAKYDPSQRPRPVIIRFHHFSNKGQATLDKVKLILWERSIYNRSYALLYPAEVQIMVDEASKTCDTPEEVTEITSSLEETDGGQCASGHFQHSVSLYKVIP